MKKIFFERILNCYAFGQKKSRSRCHIITDFPLNHGPYLTATRFIIPKILPNGATKCNYPFWFVLLLQRLNLRKDKRVRPLKKNKMISQQKKNLIECTAINQNNQNGAHVYFGLKNQTKSIWILMAHRKKLNFLWSVSLLFLVDSCGVSRLLLED